jgi:hypothetical protein
MPERRRRSRRRSRRGTGGGVSCPGEGVVQQVSVMEAQAVEVQRKHAEAEEDNHQWVRQSFWSGAMAGQKAKGRVRGKKEKGGMEALRVRYMGRAPRCARLCSLKWSDPEESVRFSLRLSKALCKRALGPQNNQSPPTGGNTDGPAQFAQVTSLFWVSKQSARCPGTFRVQHTPPPPAL